MPVYNNIKFYLIIYSIYHNIQMTNKSWKVWFISELLLSISFRWTLINWHLWIDSRLFQMGVWWVGILDSCRRHTGQTPPLVVSTFFNWLSSISNTFSHLRSWLTMLFWSSQLTVLMIWANMALNFSSGFLMTLWILFRRSVAVWLHMDNMITFFTDRSASINMGRRSICLFQYLSNYCVDCL